MFLKVITKKTKDGTVRHYASLVENRREGGKVVQHIKANIGPVTEEQIPYLRAAFAKEKKKGRKNDDKG